MSHVSADDITRAFRQLGVRPGDLLVVHGSLSSFGHVDGGADVRGARRWWGASRPAARCSCRRSPTRGCRSTRPPAPRSTGRSRKPSASSPARCGACTRRIRGPASARTRGTSLPATSSTTPFGPGSPLWRLWERDAKVLLIGVDHRADSMIHVAEESLRLPYLDRTRVAQVVRPDGTLEEVVVRRPGCSAGFSKLDAPLRAAGACARNDGRRRRADAVASPRRGLGRGRVAES